jgi:hypothetical protein
MAFALFILLLVLAFVLVLVFVKKKRLRDAAKILIILGITMPVILFLVSSPSNSIGPFYDRVIAYHYYPPSNWIGRYYAGPKLKVPIVIGIIMIAAGSIALVVGKKGG